MRLIYVRFGSLADISRPCGHVGFAPDIDQKSGHRLCRLCANSGHLSAQLCSSLNASLARFGAIVWITFYFQRAALVSGSDLVFFPITMSRVRVGCWIKMHHYRKRVQRYVPLSPRPFYPGSIISTRRYDFREGQPATYLV
jgi:hypothetical protein